MANIVSEFEHYFSFIFNKRGMKKSFFKITNTFL